MESILPIDDVIDNECGVVVLSNNNKALLWFFDEVQSKNVIVINFLQVLFQELHSSSQSLSSVSLSNCGVFFENFP